MGSSSTPCRNVPPGTSHQGRARTGGNAAGFTLLEMIVVIIIMAFIAGLVLVRHPWQSVGLNTDATLRALTDGLRLARSRAIAQDRPVAVQIARYGFSIDGGPLWALSQEQALTPAELVFTPDGGSSGGSVLLAAGQRQFVIDVNWLTGRVRSREIADR